MKVLSGSMSSFHVAEGEDYALHFIKGNVDNPKIVNLFTVIVHTPKGVSQHYVIAEDKEKAIGQALCVVKFPSCNQDEFDNVRSKAYRIPLTLQGWSHNQF